MWRALVPVVVLLAAAGCQRSSQPSPNIPAKPARVADSLEVSLIHTAGEQVILRFTNNTSEPVRILREVDGSSAGRLMPRYTFTVTAVDGTQVPHNGQCALYGTPFSGTQWPDDYLVAIEPGRSCDLTTYLPCSTLPNGIYQITFEYEYSRTQPKLPDGKHEYPPELWQGKVAAQPLQIKIARP